MRFHELLETPHYETNDETRQAAQTVCDQVMKFASDKPITIELRPEIRYENCRGIVLTDLFANVPGQGVGTIVMKYLMGLADEAGLNIYTNAEGPRSTQYYMKLGFEKAPNSGHELCYYPPFDFEED